MFRNIGEHTQREDIKGFPTIYLDFENSQNWVSFAFIRISIYNHISGVFGRLVSSISEFSGNFNLIYNTPSLNYYRKIGGKPQFGNTSLTRRDVESEPQGLRGQTQALGRPGTREEGPYQNTFGIRPRLARVQVANSDATYRLLSLVPR